MHVAYLSVLDLWEKSEIWQPSQIRKDDPNDSSDNPENLGYKILLLEDDEEMLRLLDEEFQGFGFQVRQAMNGNEALAQIDQVKPDVVVSDFRMPGGGLDFLRKLRAKCETCRIVVITSLRDDAAIAEVLEQGVDTFLGKPVRMSELLGTVNRLLD
ncbi:response regulator transcription factor [Candidatus Nitrospira salsa]